MIPAPALSLFFFFNDTATTEIYTLSLHDALPICAKTTLEWNDTKRREAGMGPPVGELLHVRERWAIVANTAHVQQRSEEHTSELQSPDHLVCRLLLEKKKKKKEEKQKTTLNIPDE